MVREFETQNVACKPHGHVQWAEDDELFLIVMLSIRWAIILFQNNSA